MNTSIGNITLTNSQQKALERILSFLETEDRRVFILRGYAGTGKTTLVRAIISELYSKGRSFSLLASTGRAAKVLSDATRIAVRDEDGSTSEISSSSRTIHSQIYTFSDINQDLDLFSQPDSNPEIATDKSIKLRFSLLHREESETQMIYIIDESSMISDVKGDTSSQAVYGTDGRLLKDLFEYDHKGVFIFIGDPCQLPPVNQVVSPALSKTYIETTFGYRTDEVELTEIVRQAEGNDIAKSAALVRKCYLNPPETKIARFPFRGYKNIHLLNSDVDMLNMYIDTIKDQDYSKSTMIVMSNKTVTKLSNIIRPILGFRERTISVGDLLLVTQNNLISGLMNGDLVKILQIGRRERRSGLSFVFVEVESLATNKVYSQLLIEDIMYSGATNITQEQQTHLFIDYHERMRAKGIKQSSPRYKDGMMNDSYLNAL